MFEYNSEDNLDPDREERREKGFLNWMKRLFKTDHNSNEENRPKRSRTLDKNAPREP